MNATNWPVSGKSLTAAGLIVFILGSFAFADSPSFIFVEATPKLTQKDASHYDWKMSLHDSSELTISQARNGDEIAVTPKLKQNATDQDLTGKLKVDLVDGHTVISFRGLSADETNLTLDVTATKAEQSQILHFNITRYHIIVLIGGRDLRMASNTFNEGSSFLERQERQERLPPDIDALTLVSHPFSIDFLNGYVSAEGPPARILVWSIDATLCRDVKGVLTAQSLTEQSDVSTTVTHNAVDGITALGSVVQSLPAGQAQPTGAIFSGGVQPDAIILYLGSFDADYLANDPALAGNSDPESRALTEDLLEARFSADFNGLVDFLALSQATHIWAVESSIPAGNILFKSGETVQLATGDTIVSRGQVASPDYNLLPAATSFGFGPGKGAGILLAQSFLGLDARLSLYPTVSAQLYSDRVEVHLKFPFSVSIQGPATTIPPDASHLLAQDFEAGDSPVSGPITWSPPSAATIDQSSGTTINLTCPANTTRVRYLSNKTLYFNLSPPSAPTQQSVPAGPQWVAMPIFENEFPSP